MTAPTTDARNADTCPACDTPAAYQGANYCTACGATLALTATTTPTADPTATIHTLRDPDGGFTCINFCATDDPDTMLVQWVDVDDGDGESGPSCRSSDEPICRSNARKLWREYTRDGWAVSSYTPPAPPRD